MDQKAPVKYILFLNLDWVVVNGVRTSTHALLIEEGPGMLTPVDRRVRGFGLDSAWAVFDVRVPTIEYTMQDFEGNAIMLTNRDPKGYVPLVSGAVVQIASDGPRLELAVLDHKRPIDVKTFEGTWGDRVTLDALWVYLNENAPKYWTAPGMPKLVWGHSPYYRRG